MTNNQTDPAFDLDEEDDRPRLWRLTRADLWMLGPSFMIGLPLGFLTGYASGSDDQPFGWFGLPLAAQIAVFAGLCALVVAGLLWICVGWLKRMDEVERLIELRTTFWDFCFTLSAALIVYLTRDVFPGAEAWIDAYGLMLVMGVACVGYLPIRAFVRRNLNA